MTKQFTTQEVAEMLGVSLRRVQAMLKQKVAHFPHARQCECGKTWYIPEKDLKGKTNVRKNT
jgi:excisionase family DNA binding protein